METELDEHALVKSNRFYRRIEFMGFDKIWKKIMDVTHLRQLTLFNRGVVSFGHPCELPTLFPNIRNLSLEINMIPTWKHVFELSKLLPMLRVLDLNYNSFAFEADQMEFRADFMKRFGGEG